MSFYHTSLLISDDFSKFAVSAFEEIDSKTGIKSYITISFDSPENYSKYNVTQPLPKPPLDFSLSNNVSFGLYIDGYFYIADAFGTQIYIFRMLPTILLGSCFSNKLQGPPRLLSFSYGIERFFVLANVDSVKIMMMADNDYFYIFVIEDQLSPFKFDIKDNVLFYINSTSPTYKDVYTLNPKNINFALNSKLSDIDICDGGAFQDDELKYEIVEFSSYETEFPKSEDFEVKVTPQVFSPIMFDLDVFQDEVVRDKEVNITPSVTYT